MSDFLVELSANPRARGAIKALGLPLPMPQKLRRATGPWEERPLFDRDVVVYGAELAATIADTVAKAGANPWVVGDTEPFTGPGEAWGRPPKSVAMDEAPETLHPHALVFDATGLENAADLKQLYAFFHPRMRSIARCGRVVVLRRPPEKMKTPAGAAAMAAVEGFTRSVAKEIGAKGATANVVTVERGAESRVEPLLRFLLSDRSAFITGQPFHVSRRVKQKGEVPLVRPLEGKVALVTGAGRGIGASTAAALAQEGATVICLDIPAADGPVSTVAYRIGGEILLCDVTAEDAGDLIKAHVTEKHGGQLDIIVHNAGVTRDKTLKKMDEGRWDMAIDVNLQAIIGLTDALLPLMPADGRIICLSSMVAISGNFGQTNYTASKAGVIGFVEHMGPELAKKGIAINAIAPGFIETRLTAAIPVASREGARRLSNLSQGGKPQDIAEVVTFLASPGAAALCGTVNRVCGGNFVGR